ncbi:MAG: hypothetical protein U9P10_07295 [Thermodesulfobacteriota bacterium]|nr:hypothetical protein [Thermodesulfobacteriota bacterium]
MPLAQENFEAIGKYVRQHMGQWLGEQSLAQPPQVYEIELRERMVRVEEELKNQRELMKLGFDQMSKRFDQVDKRFEQVDKRFDSFMRWSFGLTLTVGGLVVASIKYLQ